MTLLQRGIYRQCDSELWYGSYNEAHDNKYNYLFISSWSPKSPQEGVAEQNKIQTLKCSGGQT